MLQAMNTGHEGSLTTLHANSPKDMISRLVAMVRLGAELPVDVIEENIASALDVVVQTARSRSGQRFISQISQVLWLEEDRKPQVITVFSRKTPLEEGVWLMEPAWVEEAVGAQAISKEEVEAWRKACF